MSEARPSPLLITPPQAAVTEKPKRSLAERCAILCADPNFRQWMALKGFKADTPQGMDQVIKQRLGISSKRELNEHDLEFNAEAAANFKLLLMSYDAHRADQEYADVRR